MIRRRNIFNINGNKMGFPSSSASLSSALSFSSHRSAAATFDPPMNCAGGLSIPSSDFLLNPKEEHQMLRSTIARFAKERLGPQARKQDILGKFNREFFVQEMGSNGMDLFGLTIPEKDGGSGLDALSVCVVHHELCKYDVGFCLAYLAHAMLFVNNFYNSANEEQRKKYLPAVLSGEHIGAMGMSEPSAGTDVLGMKSVARKAKVDGKAGYILKGSKTWITNGPTADLFLIYAKNADHNCITTFIVERTMKGFSNSSTCDKLGNRSSEMCTLYFDDIFIPEENVLGGPENINGLVGMMRNLELERVAGAAMSCGMGERAVEMMIEYGRERKSFGKPINEFGQIQRYIAENFARVEAAKALTYAVASTVTPGTQNRVGTDAAKLFAGPVAKRACDDCMQVMGGMGYSNEAYSAERLWRDSKLSEIGAGTIEAHHKNLVKDLKL